MRVRVVLFVESEAIEAVAAFMTVHLLLKMHLVGPAPYGLVSISSMDRSSMRSLTPQAPEALCFRFARQESEQIRRTVERKEGPATCHPPGPRPGVIASVGVTRYTVTRYGSGKYNGSGRANEGDA